MMNTLSIHEAKANLSAVVERVRTRGEPVVLCRYGKPVAQIIPLESRQRGRRSQTHPELAATLNADPTEPTVEEWGLFRQPRGI